jgi:predicted AAA+ superfamily ATPase
MFCNALQIIYNHAGDFQLLAAIASSSPYIPNLLKLRQELFITDQRTLLKYLWYLEKAEVISTLSQKAKGNKIMQKPDKTFLGNTNHFQKLFKIRIK